MNRKWKTEQKKTVSASHRIIAFAALFVALVISVVLILGFDITGASRNARLNALGTQLETPESSNTPVSSAVPTADASPQASLTPEPTAPNYTKTRIYIDEKLFCVLASREAAEELIKNALEHFERLCAMPDAASEIVNTIRYAAAAETESTVSYDEAFSALTGEESPITVITKCNVNETSVIARGVNIVQSDEYYAGTRFIVSYGRDGKNMRLIEYTYVNGILSGSTVLDEQNLYPAVLDVMIIGTKPIPEGDAFGEAFGKEDCPAAERSFRPPVLYNIAKYFGFYEGVMHNGIDYEAPEGTPCHASAAGTVRSVMARGAYGLTIEIDHGDGFITRYAGLSSANCSIGDIVSIGDDIGTVSENGLHFELIVDSRPRNPLVYLLGLFD